MAIRSLWVNLRRVRRKLWPTERGTFRRATWDTVVGLTFLLASDRWLKVDFSYLLRRGGNPASIIATLIGGVTFAFFVLGTAFLLGCCITWPIAMVYSMLPRSWRSSEIRRIRKSTIPRIRPVHVSSGKIHEDQQILPAVASASDVDAGPDEFGSRTQK